jgi:hypothetical protein
MCQEKRCCYPIDHVETSKTELKQINYGKIVNSFIFYLAYLVQNVDAMLIAAAAVHAAECKGWWCTGSNRLGHSPRRSPIAQSELQGYNGSRLEEKMAGTLIAGCERCHSSRWLWRLRRMTTYGSTERQRAFLEAEIGSGSRTPVGLQTAYTAMAAACMQDRSRRSWPAMTRRGEKKSNLLHERFLKLGAHLR